MTSACSTCGRAKPTWPEASCPNRTSFVARVKRNILTQSYVGGIYTDGDPAGSTAARTYGADLRLATSSFMGGQRNFEFRAFGLKVANEGVEDGTASYGFGASYPNDLWDAQMDWRRIERNFRPALGFVPRNDVNQLNISVNFAPRPRDFLGIRRMVHQFRFRRFVRLEYGEVESWEIYSFTPKFTLFNLLQFDNESGNLGWQSRVRWILRPGRELFVVFNQGWIREIDETGSRVFHAGDTSLAAKAQYTIRF